MSTRPPNRTAQQNKALHLFFRKVANALNDAGLTTQLVLRETEELDWTTSMVKELLWRPTQKALLDKRSTRALLKQQDIDMVYEHLNRFVSEKFGIHVDFPTHELGYWETAPLKDEPQPTSPEEGGNYNR